MARLADAKVRVFGAIVNADFGCCRTMVYPLGELVQEKTRTEGEVLRGLSVAFAQNSCIWRAEVRFFGSGRCFLGGEALPARRVCPAPLVKVRKFGILLVKRRRHGFSTVMLGKR